MKKLIILFTIFLISTSLTPLSFAYDGARLGPADVPQGVLREGILSIKFLDAYFGTDDEKIEVARRAWAENCYIKQIELFVINSSPKTFK